MFYGWFLPRDAMLASCVRLSVCLSVCPSVRLSVTRRYCVKTAKCRITETTLHAGDSKWGSKNISPYYRRYSVTSSDFIAHKTAQRFTYFKMMSTSFLLAEISPSCCWKRKSISPRFSLCFSASYQWCHKTEATGARQCSRHETCVLHWSKELLSEPFW